MEILARLCFWGGVAVLLLVGGGITTLIILTIASKFGKVVRWEEAGEPAQLRHTRPASQFAMRASWQGAFEEHFGSPPSPALIGLYAPGSVAFCRDFLLEVQTTRAKTERLCVASFRLPAEAYTEEARSLCGQDAYAFAEDGMGNLYFVRPSEIVSEDSPVHLYDHDEETCHTLADSLTAFLSAPRYILA